MQDDSCTSEILNKLAQLLIAVLNYIVRSNDTHFDATKASTDLVFIILNTDSKIKTRRNRSNKDLYLLGNLGTLVPKCPRVLFFLCILHIEHLYVRF